LHLHLLSFVVGFARKILDIQFLSDSTPCHLSLRRVPTPGELVNISNLQFAHLSPNILFSWNPNFTVKAFVDGGNAKVLVSDKEKDRTKYRSFGKPRWNPLNANDDHASARRQDYSVQLPVMLGDNGIQLEREQEDTERFGVGLMGRYVQYKIENTQGYLAIRSLSTESYEDQREPRAQT